jgi:hypothetical protein
MVLSTFAHASFPPRMSSTFLRFVGCVFRTCGACMVFAYGHVVQANNFDDDDDSNCEDEEEAEELAAITWRRVPSSGQNHIITR